MKKQEGQCMHQCNIEVHSHNHCYCGEKNKYYIFWVCVCSLSYPTCIVYALYYIVICDHIFSHYLISSTVFGKKLLDIKCALWFSLPILSASCLTIRRTERDIITSVYGSSRKYLLFLSDFNETWLFSIIFKKYSNVMQIHPVGAELFHADGKTNWLTDRT